MKRNGKGWCIIFRILPALSGLLALSCAPAAAADLRLIPDSIRIGPFFSGASVHVSGKVPVGERAVLEMIGKRIEEQLLRKGRRWDIWMSVGEIDIEDAPNLYFVLSTDPKEFSESGENAKFGYTALRKRIYFKGDVKVEKATWENPAMTQIPRKKTARRRSFFQIPQSQELAHLCLISWSGLN